MSSDPFADQRAVAWHGWHTSEAFMKTLRSLYVVRFDGKMIVNPDELDFIIQAVFFAGWDATGKVPVCDPAAMQRFNLMRMERVGKWLEECARINERTGSILGDPSMGCALAIGLRSAAQMLREDPMIIDKVTR